jgi:hypothetical protein
MRLEFDFRGNNTRILYYHCNMEKVIRYHLWGVFQYTDLLFGALNMVEKWV